MNQHDKELVAWAQTLSYIDWNLIDENAAETEEGRHALHRIAVNLYHLEEASCGLI